MSVPAGLNRSGSALWKSLGHTSTTTAAGRVALEACRTADRLDELDSIIQGKGVLQLMRFRQMLGSGDGSDGHPVNIEVKFDNVLGEARQQQNGLRQLLISLANMDKGEKPAKPSTTAAASTVDEFTTRRRARGA